MGDIFCNFLDSRSYVTNLHSLFPARPSSTSSVTRITANSGARRNRRKLIKTTLCKPSSSNLDVVTVDDPSEVRKNVELEEVNTSPQRKEGPDVVDKTSKEEGKEGFSIVKVIDGDHERQVFVKKVERDMQNSSSMVVDIEKKSIVSISEKSSVLERETESSKKLLEDSKEVDFPVSVSSIEESGSSSSNVQVKRVEHIEGSSNKKGENVSVPSSSPVENNNNDLQHVLEENIGHGTTLQSFSMEPDPITDVANDTKITKNGEKDIEAPELSTLSENQKLEGGTENETIEGGTLSNTVELMAVSQSEEAALRFSKDAEDHGLEASAVIPNEVLGDGHKNDRTAELPVSPQSKSAMKSFTDAKDQILESGSDIPIETVEDCRQREMIEETALSPQLETETIRDDEGDHSTIHKSGERNRTETELVNEILEPERSREAGQSGDLAQVSGHEVTELKSVESAVESTEIPKAGYVLSSGAALLSHPAKVLTGGEDAYFFTNQNWLGVADGSGRWSLAGYTQGIYAKELMENCEKIVSDYDDVSISRPIEALKLIASKSRSPGLSTALIAYFDGQALQVANVGDSGFIILRQGSVHKRSSPMFHELNFPLQIESGDDPSHLVEEYRVDLEEGDVIITATDGLFDNLYEQEVASIVLKSLEADKKLEEIAELLATRAQEVGGSAPVRSPFSDSIQAAGYKGYTGGKLDDVAIIVSVVKRQLESSTR